MASARTVTSLSVGLLFLSIAEPVAAQTLSSRGRPRVEGFVVIAALGQAKVSDVGAQTLVGLDKALGLERGLTERWKVRFHAGHSRVSGGSPVHRDTSFNRVTLSLAKVIAPLGPTTHLFAEGGPCTLKLSDRGGWRGGVFGGFGVQAQLGTTRGLLQAGVQVHLNSRVTVVNPFVAFGFEF